MLRKLLKSRRGESLIEILVAGVVFMILLGTLHAGVSFARGALVKAGELRENAFAVQRSVRGAAPGSGGTNADLSFGSPDGAGSFTVQVKYRTVTGYDKSGEPVEFHVFGAREDGP